MQDLEFRRLKFLTGGVDLLDLIGGTAGEALGSRGGERGDDSYYGFGQRYDYSPPFKNVVLGRANFWAAFL